MHCAIMTLESDIFQTKYEVGRVSHFQAIQHTWRKTARVNIFLPTTNLDVCTYIGLLVGE